MSSKLIEVKNRVCPCNREITWISKTNKKTGKVWYFHSDGTPCLEMD